jgi:hypothetical protein
MTVFTGSVVEDTHLESLGALGQSVVAGLAVAPREPAAQLPTIGCHFSRSRAPHVTQPVVATSP